MVVRVHPLATAKTIFKVDEEGWHLFAFSNLLTDQTPFLLSFPPKPLIILWARTILVPLTTNKKEVFPPLVFTPFRAADCFFHHFI